MWRQCYRRPNLSRDLNRVGVHCRSLTSNLETPGTGEMSGGSVPSPAPFDICIPGLTLVEQSFIRGQLKYLQGLSPVDLEKKHFLEYDEIIKKKYFRHFGKWNSISDGLKRRMSSNPVGFFQTCESFRLLNLDKTCVYEKPSLLETRFAEMPYLAELCQLLEVRLTGVLTAREVRSLRSVQVVKYLKDIHSSLETLRLSNERDATYLERRVFKKKANTIARIESHVCQLILKDLAGESGQNPDFVSETWVKMRSYPSCVSAKSLMRNIYILGHVIGIDVSNPKTPLHSLHPLETLVVLNDLFYAMKMGVPAEEQMSQEFFFDALRGPGMKHIFFPPRRSPTSVRKQLLMTIGFSGAEANQIILFNPEMSYKIQVSKQNTKCIPASSKRYVEEMQSRFYALKSKMTAEAAPKSPVEALELMKSAEKASLCALLGNPEVSESVLRKKIMLRQLSKKQRLPFERIAETINFLKDAGFTNDDMMTALPLLSHSKAVVAAKLEDMRHIEAIDYHELVEKKKVLVICLYLIEKDLNFVAHLDTRSFQNSGGGALLPCSGEEKTINPVGDEASFLGGEEEEEQVDSVLHQLRSKVKSERRGGGRAVKSPSVRQKGLIGESSSDILGGATFGTWKERILTEVRFSTQASSAGKPIGASRQMYETAADSRHDPNPAS